MKEYVYNLYDKGDGSTFNFKVNAVRDYILFDIEDMADHTSHCSNLSPKKAREIADALYECANGVELLKLGHIGKDD